jgi:hypothetical protein
MKTPLAAAAVAAILIGGLTAQSLHVVPNAWDDADAPAMLSVPGITGSERQQILIDASHLAALVGRDITGLLFRRDAGDATALSLATATLTVRMGTSPHAAAAATADFAANAPQAVLTYQGTLTAPLSPSTEGRPIHWSGADIIEIVFQTPYPYAGGNLCIEFDGVATSPGWWPIDATEDPASGSVVADGTACGNRAQVLGQTAFVAAADLVVGRTAICKLFGEPRSNAILIVGADILPTPTDLALIGAPGCFLYVAPISAIPSTMSDSLAGTPFGGVANVHLRIPPLPALLAASFALQWVETGVGVFATSNALRCQISSSTPALGMATVWQRPGGGAVVDPTTAPVIGLRY